MMGNQMSEKDINLDHYISRVDQWRTKWRTCSGQEHDDIRTACNDIIELVAVVNSLRNRLNTAKADVQQLRDENKAIIELSDALTETSNRLCATAVERDFFRERVQHAEDVIRLATVAADEDAVQSAADRYFDWYGESNE